jgi:hypothetical protein
MRVRVRDEDAGEDSESSRDVNIRANELIFLVKKDHRPNSSSMQQYQELVMYLVKSSEKLGRQSFFHVEKLNAKISTNTS